MPSPSLRARFAVALTALLVFVSLPEVVDAQTKPGPQLVDVRVGFEGKFKLACWTPVELTLQGGDSAKSVTAMFTVPDGDGVPISYPSPPFQLLPGRTTTVVIYVRFGRLDADAELIVREGSERIIKETLETSPVNGRLGIPYALSNDDRLVVSIGSLPTLTEVAAELQLGNNRQLETATIADPRRLPTRWQAYEGVDAVILAPGKSESFATLTPDAAQVVALRQWVELGGRLATLVTIESQPLFGPQGSLRSFSRDVAAGSTPLPRTTALEKFAGSDIKQAIAPAALRKSPLEVPRLDVSDAVVTAGEGDLPLVVQRAFGLGTTVVASFTPEHPLFTSWSGRNAMMRQLLVLLGVLSEREAEKKPGTSGGPNYGYDDLAGQLRAALDQYEGVQAISFFTLAVMVLAYLALIGPVDYLLVRKVFKRPELTWITFPTMVVATSIGAYYLAVHLKGSQLRVSQADVLDCDAASGTIRTTSWAGVFSPVGRNYDVRFDGTAQSAGPLDLEQLTGWMGLPGTGLGGMHTDGGSSWFTQPYFSTVNGDGLRDAPIQVWSSKMFIGRSSARATNSLHAPLIAEADRRLSGSVRNPFPYVLQNALLCFGGRAYELGNLEPNQPIDLARLDVRDIQSVLQSWRVVLSANKNPLHVGQPHDPGSLETAEILRKMMFYAAAGGQDHARLENRAQSFLDLSALLKLQRAVLIAQVDPSALGTLQLTVGGAEPSGRVDRRNAFVRLVIPVGESQKSEVKSQN